MKYISCLLLAFVLCGCVRVNMNDQEEYKEEIEIVEKTVLCKHEDGKELLLHAKNDELTKFQESFEVSFDDIGITSEMDKEEAISKINDVLSNKYADIVGVSARGELKEDSVLITLMIDYEIADFDELIENGFIKEGERESQYISLKSSIQSYEEQDFACEIQ